jgi:ABC-type uncharacterized transport system permease subunit
MLPLKVLTRGPTNLAKGGTALGLVLLPLAIIAYFNGVFLALLGVVHQSEPARRGAAASWLVAWTLHLAAIVFEWSHRGQFPLTNAADYLLVLGWVTLSLYLVVYFYLRVHQVGLVLPPLAALMALVALLLPASKVSLPPAHERGWFLFHVSVSVLGMASLCLAFAMSIIYLLQDRALKSKRAPKILARFPSLEVCDRVGYQSVLWGFPLLTLGIATGEVLSWVVRETLWIGGAKQIFPLLAWAVLAVLLYARLLRGTRGRRSAYLTIAGFTLGLLTVFGMTR